MDQVTISYNGITYKIDYYQETHVYDSPTSGPIYNLYSVFITDPSLQAIAGNHFIISHDITIPGKKSPQWGLQTRGPNENPLKTIIVKAITGY